MKLVISAALLVLLGGLPAFARQEPEEKDKPKPAQQEEPKKQEPEKQKPQSQEKPQEKQQEKQQAKQEEKQQKDAAKQQTQKQEKEQADKAKQTEKSQQQAAKQQQQAEKDRAKQDKSAQEHAQQIQQPANGQQAQRDGGNRNARRISDADFHSHFGRAHTFHVERRDDRRFHYGGYWFEFSDPWPTGWSYSDDVYVDEIDGEYYLIDPVHPGIRILVVVVA